MSDVLLNILEQMKESHPASEFIASLHQQYCVRGGLSRKQLEGLYAKAARSEVLSQAKLATLDAIIKKKPTRERAAATIRQLVDEKDTETGSLLEKILVKYPNHKRIIFLKSKYDKNDPLSVVEKDEIKKFSKLLLGDASK